GFRRYLQHINPQRRNWTWHLRKTLVFYQVYFLRSILRAAGNYKTAYSIYKRIKALLIYRSQLEYKELYNLLIGKLF
ncbi:uncharacterized protein K441DRAFT_595127, partial [Cenococcum geophilum 1.58]